jgi:endo-1,3-1,4-beta-glycanase ExoK
MYKKSSLLIFVSLILGLSTQTSAICFNTRTLASYEPYESDDLNTPPDGPNVTATWERGGVNDVPEATEGDYVLKLSWPSEIDHKIAVGHYWNYTRFDLAAADFIHADVYVPDESAMPGTMGIWDNSWQYKWIGADCEPIRTNEWRSIAFGVSALSEVGLDHIEALVFDALAGTSGTIYIDNLRIGAAEGDCQCKRKIVFSGYTWSVLQSEWEMGVGPNRFTDTPNDVRVDPNGHLHLSVVYKDPNWYCSEAVANENFGYGSYVFTLRDEVNSLDPNIILGAFVYDVPDAFGKPREIDFEFTRWSDANDPNNAQYAVQPANEPNLLHRFRIDYSADTETTTHVVTWKPSRIDFSSYYRDYTPHPRGKDIIDFWSYIGEYIPKPGCENPRINFWLRWGHPPINGQNAEIVIKRFRYLPLGDLDNDYDVDFVDFALFTQKWLVDVK